MNELAEKVYEFLKIIPDGKVVTYGQIGQVLGNKNLARVIGNILHVNPDPIGSPCYKVVNSKGYLATCFADGGIEVQKKRLEKDGISVLTEIKEIDKKRSTIYRVDLKKYQWEI